MRQRLAHIRATTDMVGIKIYHNWRKWFFMGLQQLNNVMNYET